MSLKRLFSHNNQSVIYMITDLPHPIHDAPLKSRSEVGSKRARDELSMNQDANLVDDLLAGDLLYRYGSHGNRRLVVRIDQRRLMLLLLLWFSRWSSYYLLSIVTTTNITTSTD